MINLIQKIRVIDSEEIALKYAKEINPQISKYFQEDFTPVKALQLNGGYANYIFRIILQSKEKRNASQSFIIKMYPPYLAKFPEIPFTQDRIKVEYQALKLINIYKNNWKNHTNFTVPNVIFYDSDANVILMEDIGQNLIYLTDLLMKEENREYNKIQDIQKESDITLESIASNLNQFLQLVFEIELSEEDKDIFQNIIKWDQKDIIKPLTQYFEKYPQLQEYVENFTPFENQTKYEKKAIIFGDLWPNQILIDVEKRQFFLIDWEIARLDTFNNGYSQIMNIFWVLTQSKLFDQANVQRFMNELTIKFLGNAVSDWRTFNKNSKALFLITVILFAQIPNWEITSMTNLIEEALKQIINLP